MTRAPLFMLYLSVLVVASCGLIYELLAGTLASYVLGDSVTQFSLIIGVYLFAMGVGAWLSQFIQGSVARRFIEVQLAVGLIGGCSAPALFLGFAYLSWFRGLLFGLVFVIGTLVGLELPLCMRILREHLNFSDLVSRVLALDYVGALFASLAFPMFLVPHLGLVRTSLVFGVLNTLVGLWGTWFLKPILPPGNIAGLRARGVVVLVVLLIGLLKADRLTTLAEDNLFSNPVVYATTTPYQRIVVTQTKNSFQLFLNGHLQFNSADEYRYHEALVHPALAAVTNRQKILVLGGGDGLALREIFKYRDVESVTLVDIDPEMTKLSDRFEPLRQLSGDAMNDPRVHVIHQDAFLWLEGLLPQFNVVIIDFPDPNSFTLGKLYTTRFYRLLKRCLLPGAAVGIQCTSPIIAPASYWCILRTLETAGFVVKPYHAAVPSFGIWGYALARMEPFTAPDVPHQEVQDKLRFLNANSMRALFELPADFAPVAVEINRLDNQMLVRYYEEEWGRWD